MARRSGATASVTQSFVDMGLSVVRFMLNSPEVEDCLREMDDYAMDPDALDGLQNLAHAAPSIS